MSPATDRTPDDMRLPAALGAIDEAALRAAGLCEVVGPCPTMPALLDESRRRAAQGAIQRSEIRDVRDDLAGLRDAVWERIDRLETRLTRTRWRSMLGTSGAAWIGSTLLPYVLWYLATISTGRAIPLPPVPTTAAVESAVQR
jgi:hypothetical protein